MNILVLLPVNDRHRAILESSAPGEDFIYTSSDAATREQVADADVILGNIDPALLTACKHLQLLQLQTAGYDDYLAAGTVPADAKLSCSVGAYGQAVSEHMFAMVLSMMKRLPGYHDLQREHRWEDLGPVTSLKNANVLVLGAGDIGGHFATLCRSMGAHVRGIKRHPLVYPIVFEDMDGMDALSERLAEADVVASFMPSTPETRGLANAEFFAAMKPGAFFANGGRGDLVVAEDLVAALESGHLAGLQVTQILCGNVDHIVERSLQVEPTGDVRRDEHVGRIPQRACGGQRLGVGDVEARAEDLAAAQGFHKLSLIHI